MKTFTHKLPDGFTVERKSSRPYTHVVATKYRGEGRYGATRWSESEKAAQAFAKYLAGPKCVPFDDIRVETINNGTRPT